MEYRPFSYDYLDWLRTQLLEFGAPEITEENLFDCRNLDLVERVRKALTSALGWCVVLDLPQAEPVEDKEDTYALVHAISVTLTVLRGPLCRVDTTAVAETLYRFFLTRHFRAVPGLFAPDVACGPYRNEIDTQGNYTQSFTLTAQADITKD